MPTMTAAQQAVADAANLLAKTEYDANKALLGKLTTFLSDYAAYKPAMGLPPRSRPAWAFRPAISRRSRRT